MNRPVKHAEIRRFPFEDAEPLGNYINHVCKSMVDDISHKIANFISSKGEYSFKLHEVTECYDPRSRSTEIKMVLDVQKITRCKDCIYRRNTVEKYCSIHPYRGLAEPWNDDWFCGDGKEKDDECTENNQLP